MDKRMAKAYVLRVLAAEVRHHVSNGSEWIERPIDSDGIAVSDDGAFSAADIERVQNAVLEVADELEARSKRLSRKGARHGE